MRNGSAGAHVKRPAACGPAGRAGRFPLRWLALRQRLKLLSLARQYPANLCPRGLTSHRNRRALHNLGSCSASRRA